MKMQSIRLRSRGQALVLVLLSLAVVLTIVLFVLSRSVTDIAVSSRGEEAVRAFSAAEAGIENALVLGAPGSNTIGDASYKASVSGFAENLTDFNYPIAMSSGDSMTTWFVSHDPTTGNLECTDGKCFTGSSMKVCWGKPGTSASSSTTPAIEISVFYEVNPSSLSTIQIGRATADPNSGRIASNKFAGSDSSGGCTISDVNYAFQKTVNFSDIGIPASSYNAQDGLQFARVRMLYNDQTQPVGVAVPSGGTTLPSQGSDIISTGTAGESNRKVEVYQGWPEVPSVFDAAVFSSSGLVKNVLSSTPAPTSAPGSSTATLGTTLTNGVISVSYSDIPVPSATDWLGIYVPGTADIGNALEWVYIRSSGTCLKETGDAEALGSCQFNVPGTLAPGTYEARLFSSNSYTKLATSGTFVVPEPPPTPTPEATPTPLPTDTPTPTP